MCLRTKRVRIAESTWGVLLAAQNPFTYPILLRVCGAPGPVGGAGGRGLGGVDERPAFSELALSVAGTARTTRQICVSCCVRLWVCNGEN